MGSPNGGIIGVINPTSFGKCTVTSVTSTSCHTFQPGTRSVTTLLVAGGGGSGNTYSGGGGAGGYKILESIPVSGESSPVVIGAGGSAGGAIPGAKIGSKGTNTTFLGYTACGGGASGAGSDLNAGACANGGSGAGGTPASSPGTGVCGQGNAGGAGTGSSPPNFGTGGGGGATSAGTGGTSTEGGPGGTGIDITPYFGAAPQPFYIANSPNRGATACGVFAGGGGGGYFAPGGTPGSGGTGGGGNGADCSPSV
jgi:hypothetical protein